ncbi:MAG: permease-like cell division protein FtsX [Clostridiales Family XIII bacterium]|jgi:cell division transport system permease protein|nr:permease-like cell division protein FtsX [Clostridiales Family XIII bacterium]
MNNKLIQSIVQAIRQIGRNKTMVFASLFSITAILLILGLFFILLVNVNNMSQGIKSTFDQVQVNLLDTTTRDEASELMQQFEAMDAIENVTYQARETALENWKVKWGDNADLLDRLTVNPLPNAIIVKLHNVEDAEDVVAVARAMKGVERVAYSQDTVDKLISVTNGIQVVALVLIAFLLVVSVIVVSNTIKLTVLAREREITIMKYIGATNWYIRGPFLMEGITLGLIAAAISGVIVSSLYHYVVQSFGLDFMMVLQMGFVRENFLITNLAIVFISLGISIGAVGSIISMRRFLDTK